MGSKVFYYYREPLLPPTIISSGAHITFVVTMEAACQNKRKGHSHRSAGRSIRPKSRTGSSTDDEELQAGSGGRLKVEYESIGRNAYNDFLKDHGWMWLESYNIYHFGLQNDEATVDKLEDGVDRFFGLEELGKCVEKYSRGEVLRRAKWRRAQLLAAGRSSSGDAAAVADTAAATDVPGPAGVPILAGIAVRTNNGRSKIDRRCTASQNPLFQAVARHDQQRQQPVIAAAQAPTELDANGTVNSTNNVPSTTVSTNSDPPISAAVGGVGQARCSRRRSGRSGQPVRQAGQSKTRGLNPSGGLGGGPKASKYEHLGTEAWKTIGGPHGLQHKQVQRDQLYTDDIFHFGLKNNKNTIDKLEEGVTKFTGYEALGKCYEEHGFTGLLKRAMGAPNSNARLVPLQTAVGDSGRRSVNAASSNAMPAEQQQPMASLTLGAAEANGPSVSLNSRGPSQATVPNAAVAQQQPQQRPATMPPAPLALHGNEVNSNGPPAAATAAARNSLLGTGTSKSMPKPVSDQKAPAVKNVKARLAALEMEIVGTASNGSIINRLENLEQIAMDEKFRGSLDQRVKNLEKWAGISEE